MKKLMTVLLLIGILVLNATVLFAAPKDRNHARHVIRRTAVVLVAAQKSANEGGVYVGLGRAVGHQMVARELFRQGHYLRAIHHSFRARALAINVLRRNQRAMIREAKYDRTELKYVKSAPKDDDLDVQIKLKEINDDESLKVKIDMDID